MNILAVGDVVSQEGCDYLRKQLSTLKRTYHIDVVIVNGENSAAGNGILPQSADHIFDSGADVITTGNHVFRRREIYDYLTSNEAIIRPANYTTASPGRGYYLLDMGRHQVCVINLMGLVYLQPLACPFQTVDRILSEISTKHIIIDFHAEATGEKIALAHYLDGRVSAIFGTHTHVQTADEQILPNGTGYISDVGMTGPWQSALGVNPENVIEQLITHMPVKFKTSQNPCKLNAVVFELDDNTGKCSKILRIIS